MGKLEDFITDYTTKADILLELEAVPAPPPIAGPLPVEGEPLAAGAQDVAADTPEVTEPKSLTTPGYASLVEDAIMLLRIGMMKGEDWRMDDNRVNDLFDDDVDSGDDSKNQNVTAMHETIRDLIRDYKCEIE